MPGRGQEGWREAEAEEEGRGAGGQASCKRHAPEPKASAVQQHTSNKAGSSYCTKQRQDSCWEQPRRRVQEGQGEKPPATRPAWLHP